MSTTTTTSPTNAVPNAGKLPEKIGHLVHDNVAVDVGVLVKEIGPRSKGRHGEVVELMKVYAWVEQEDGKRFKKMKKYLKACSHDDVAEDRFVDAPIDVDTLIECVG